MPVGSSLTIDAEGLEEEAMEQETEEEIQFKQLKVNQFFPLFLVFVFLPLICYQKLSSVS